MPTKPNIIVDSLDIPFLHKRLLGLTGTAFIIVIQQDDGKFGIHDRPNNPCQGGHLRKYGTTHPDCTRPKDPDPGDLRMPFPDGKPHSLVYKVSIKTTGKELFEAGFSDDSPWISGFGGSENVVLLPSRFPGTSYDGFYLKTGNFDPTVLVNLLKQVSYKTSKLFITCRECGLSVTEALTFCAFFYEQDNNMVPLQNAYTFDPLNSARRMVKKRSVNLTGGVFDKQGKLLSKGSGLWGDRFDYNRPDMACVFRPDKSLDKKDQKEPLFNISKRYREVKGKSSTVTIDQCIEIFNEAKSYDG